MLNEVCISFWQKFEIDMEEPKDTDFVEDMADVEARTEEQKRQMGKYQSTVEFMTKCPHHFHRTHCV